MVTTRAQHRLLQEREKLDKKKPKPVEPRDTNTQQTQANPNPQATRRITRSQSATTHTPVPVPPPAKPLKLAKAKKPAPQPRASPDSHSQSTESSTSESESDKEETHTHTQTEEEKRQEEEEKRKQEELNCEFANAVQSIEPVPPDAMAGKGRRPGRRGVLQDKLRLIERQRKRWRAENRRVAEMRTLGKQLESEPKQKQNGKQKTGQGQVRKGVYTICAPLPVPGWPEIPLDDSKRIHDLFESTRLFWCKQTWFHFIVGINNVMTMLYRAMSQPPNPHFVPKPKERIHNDVFASMQDPNFAITAIFVERSAYSPLILEQLCGLVAQVSYTRGGDLRNNGVRLVAFPDDEPEYVSLLKMLRNDHKVHMRDEQKFLDRDMTILALSRHVVVDFPKAAAILDAVRETVPPLTVSWRKDLLRGVYTPARAEEMRPSMFGSPLVDEQDVDKKG